MKTFVLTVALSAMLASCDSSPVILPGDVSTSTPENIPEKTPKSEATQSSQAKLSSAASQPKPVNKSSSSSVSNPKSSAAKLSSSSRTVIVPPPPQPPLTGEWKLVWSDEFSGNEINPANWTLQTGGGGWGNQEIQYYTDRTTKNRNAYVKSGMLHIVARHEQYGNRNYTSARMYTKDKQDFLYGRIEARIKAPHNIQTGVMDPGAWPAFWMMGRNFDQVGWPYCGEIDVWETGGRDPHHVSGAVHWNDGGYAPAPYKNVHFARTVQHPTQLQHNFHVYRIEWDPQFIKWYIDDTYMGAFDHAGLGAGNPFNKAHFLLLNIAVEGTYYFSDKANPDNYPQVMLVDWVRVYQR